MKCHVCVYKYLPICTKVLNDVYVAPYTEGTSVYLHCFDGFLQNNKIMGEILANFLALALHSEKCTPHLSMDCLICEYLSGF